MKTKQVRVKPEYQPKTGLPCDCKPGVQRDNCLECEGTGQCIDFVAIRARRQPAGGPLSVASVGKLKENMKLTIKQHQEWNRAGFALKAAGMPNAASLAFDTAKAGNPARTPEQHARGCGCEKCTGIEGGVDLLNWES